MPRLILATSAILAAAACLSAQTAPPAAAPASDVLGVGNFIHVAADLDKAIEFYRDVIGLPLNGASGPHLFSASAIVSTLYDAPTQSRVASLRIPGSEMAVEIVEFKDSTTLPAPPRVQDPGAIMLRLTLPDLEAVMARVKQAKAAVVTTGGEPVTFDDGSGPTREVLLRDPDGIYIRLVQADAAHPAGAGFGVTVVDTEKTMQAFRDVLGFQPKVDAAFHTGEKQMAVTGTPGMQFRRSTALIPGSTFQMEFLEFKASGQKPAHPAIHDPGASVLRLRVRDLDRVVAGLKAAGDPIVSTGGQAVSIGRSRAVIVREVDNLFLQPMQ